MRFLILTGMSGAGKTTAARYLEDRGVFCVDNLPPVLLVRFVEALKDTSAHVDMTAISVDVRGAAFFNPGDVGGLIQELRHVGYQVEVLFLDAADDVLVSRYKETRRDHPLASDTVSLTEAIAQERALLEPLKETADFVIDTTGLRPKALQKKLSEVLSEEAAQEALHIEVVSFGFKRGIPRQGDLMFDVRFLPNPFYIEGLAHQTGLDEEVRTFVLSHPVTEEFLRKIRDLLGFLLPHYVEEGKHRLVIAVGCTGGAHRSVAIAEEIGKYLRELNYPVDVNHRDLDMERAYWKNAGEEA